MSKTTEEIEKEFTEVCAKISPQIQEKLSAAAKLINEAEALAEEHGVPFEPDDDIMWCTPAYIPESFAEKFPEIDHEFVYEVANVYPGCEYNGWQQSQTC